MNAPKTEEAQFAMNELRPAVLLITLGELGMLLCQRGQKPFAGRHLHRITFKAEKALQAARSVPVAWFV